MHSSSSYSYESSLEFLIKTQLTISTSFIVGFRARREITCDDRFTYLIYAIPWSDRYLTPTKKPFPVWIYQPNLFMVTSLFWRFSSCCMCLTVSKSSPLCFLWLKWRSAIDCLLSLVRKSIKNPFLIELRTRGLPNWEDKVCDSKTKPVVKAGSDRQSTWLVPV